MSDRAPATQSYHHGDLRAALLEQAEQDLVHRGVDGLSLRRLARQVGVSHTAPARHFADRRALLDALAELGFTRLRRAFADGIASSGPLEERLSDVGRTYVRFAVENAELLALMFSRKRAGDANETLAESAMEAFAVPLDLVGEAQAKGILPQGDPAQVGMSLLATAQGVASFRISGLLEPEDVEPLLQVRAHR